MISDDMLSQDEIDALLKGTEDLEIDEKEQNDVNIEDYFSSMEQDALGEIGNISFGSSATALSTLLNQKVEITTPQVSIVAKDRLDEEFPQPYVAVIVNYTEGFSGTNLLVIKQKDAAIIADLMLGGEGNPASVELDEIQLSAVQEAMNQMMGSSATSMSTIFSKKVDISPPRIDILNIPQNEGTENIPEEDLLVKVSFRLTIGNLIDSTIMQLLTIPFAKDMVNNLLNPGMSETPTSTEPESIGEAPVQREETRDQAAYQYSGTEQAKDFGASAETGKRPESGMGQTSAGHSYQNESQRDAYQEPFHHQQYSGPQHYGMHHMGGEKANIQPAEFSSFEPYHLPEAETKNLNMLMDIPLQVTVELGRTKKAIKEILELSAGSIIELDKLAGEPVDILVNNRLIAKGEVVVIDENFGVRVTDIISQRDRIKKLS